MGHTYHSIDLRVAAVRDGDIWWNSLAILRFSCLTPDAANHSARGAHHSRRLETANFRIETDVRPFTDLRAIRTAAEEGFLDLAGLKIHLRQRIEWSALRPGYLAAGGHTTTAEGNERWPGVEISHGQSSPHFLHDPVRHREVSVYGYESPYEAIASICGANVWPSTSHSGELYLWFPVFATLADAVLSPSDRRLVVRITKHSELHDLFLSGSLTPYGGNGVTHRFHNRVLSETESDAKFQTLESSSSLPVGPVTDRVEMRLSHQNLGEVERISRYATEPFDLSEWSRARVNIDYHVSFDSNLYSVPYNLVHELVEIRSTPTTVEVLHKGARVASHLRSRGRGQATTNEEHRPKSHRAHLEWTHSRMVHWAESIGPYTARLFERIMNDKPHPEMGYRGCLGIIRLAEKYSAARVEAASERALLTSAWLLQKRRVDFEELAGSGPAILTAAIFYTTT